MIINIKQNEIESAIQGYIAAQGISLFNKDVIISFTAGRKGSGLTAEVSIDDAAKPLVPHILKRGVDVVAPTAIIVPQVAQEEVINEVVEEVEPAKTTSLFG